jgi:hypothetical protein
MPVKILCGMLMISQDVLRDMGQRVDWSMARKATLGRISLLEIATIGRAKSERRTNYVRQLFTAWRHDAQRSSCHEAVIFSREQKSLSGRKTFRIVIWQLP